METLIRITPWIDPVVDQHGHDPRSSYVERFWLGTLGPTSVLPPPNLVADGGGCLITARTPGAAPEGAIVRCPSNRGNSSTGDVAACASTCGCVCPGGPLD